MHWPIKLLINKKTTGSARWLNGSHDSSGAYRIFWQSSKPTWRDERNEHGELIAWEVHSVAAVQVLINRRLALALRHAWSAPRLAIRDLKHRFYYGRLDYQYECGLADGRREVLENPETYKDLTPQEFQAAIARPEHQ